MGNWQPRLIETWFDRKIEATALATQVFFFFKQKTAYDMIWCWSSDVCSSDLDVVGELRDRPDDRDGRWLDTFGLHALSDVGERSEERRVGKSVDLGGRRII